MLPIAVMKIAVPWQPERDVPAPQPHGASPIGPPGAERGIRPEHIHQPAAAREKLAEDGRRRGARIPHAEYDDKQQIQPDVEQRGRDQDDERRPGIPHGPKGGGSDVVENDRADAAETDEKVPIGVSEIFIGRLHQPKQRPRKRHRHGHQQKREKHAQFHRRRYAPPYALPVSRAEPLAGAHGEARSQPGGKPENEKRDGPRAPHPRHRVGGNGMPHDEGIRLLYSC